MDRLSVHRPRNVGWARAGAFLYGDWGTSKAYVLGLAFVAAGFSSLPIILAVCVLTGIVGYNYILICRNFPDGGGVYSAARKQSRLLAAMGALLLVADLTVTAAMSGWDAMRYFGVPEEYIRWATLGMILLIAAINYFGPKHSGSVAFSLAIPMVLVVLAIIGLSLPHLTLAYLEPATKSFAGNWVAFTGVILALSGVESIANLTGVMKLDPASTSASPIVSSTVYKAIVPVALEVVVGTALLGWAMLSLPKPVHDLLPGHRDDMMRFLAQQYGTLALGSGFGAVFGVLVGLVVGLLLLSAVNTAVAALIGLTFMMARDGEMPRSFTRLNPHGVPWWPLAIAVLLPSIVVLIAADLESLAGLYAIGVVGAITVNLGSCAVNKELRFHWFERVLLGVTFVIMFVIEITIAKTKPDALFFAVCVVGLGLSLRAFAQKQAGLRTLTVSEEVAAAVAPDSIPDFHPNLSATQTILVAARGLNPVLSFALEEARLRQASLYVLYVKELAVTFSGPLQSGGKSRWQDDKDAAQIMYAMLASGRQHEVSVVPMYAVSDDPAGTILDLSATVGVDILMLGTSHRRTLVSLLKGDVVTEVARNLPENIQLVIYG